MPFMEKDGVVMEVTSDIQVSAFTNSGWVEVSAQPLNNVNETSEPQPEKKTRTKKGK